MTTTQVEEEESLDLACRGLKAAVNNYLKKRRRHWTESQQQQRQKEAIQAEEHACHILRTLTSKRQSLRQGIQVLRTLCWKQCRERLDVRDPVEMTSLLQHVLYQYLRLRDGMVLLVSGECRHAGDIHQASRTKYASQFTNLSRRDDGYTILYSSELGYSGFGWDEFFDPNVGVQRRLVKALSGKWDTLLEYGAQSFETCLDQHEVKLKEAQNELEEFRKTVVDHIHSLLGPNGTVRMVTQDKMERLQVIVNQNIQICLERRANDFKVHDPQGVLPNEWGRAEWERAMKLPPRKRKMVAESEISPTIPSTKTTAISSSKTSLNKNRKRIIEDDSDSDDAPTPIHTDGLRVRVQTTTNSPLDKESSLAAIKTNLGVDAKGLQAAREVLEAEEGGNQDLVDADHTASDEVMELKSRIQAARKKVELLNRVLARVTKKAEDEYEIWDAREALRESIMNLGIHLLSLHSIAEEDGALSLKHLTEARDLFRRAIDLVKEQEAAHERFSTQTNDLSEESCMIRRSLLLLRGRAHTNLGIAFIETSLTKHQYSAALRRSSLVDGVRELEYALGCASAMRSHSVADRFRGARLVDMDIDKVKADQLCSLASRWVGHAQWHQGYRKKAVATFQQASSLFDEARVTKGNDVDLVEAEILLGVECFYGCTSLVDLASDAIAALQIPPPGRHTRDEIVTKSESLYEMAKKSYLRAKEITSSLANLTKTNPCGYTYVDICDEHAVFTQEEINALMSELKISWEKMKTGMPLQDKQRQHVGEGTETNIPPRNDLFSNGESGRAAVSPGRRFFVVDGQRSRKRAFGRFKSGRGGADGNRFAIDHPSNELDDVGKTQNPVQRYRAWGDELLPQMTTESGQTVPIIVYPACAPDPPADV